jgi:hypothetical protein
MKHNDILVFCKMNESMFSSKEVVVGLHWSNINKLIDTMIFLVDAYF